MNACVMGSCAENPRAGDPADGRARSPFGCRMRVWPRERYATLRLLYRRHPDRSRRRHVSWLLITTHSGPQVHTSNGSKEWNTPDHFSIGTILMGALDLPFAAATTSFYVPASITLLYLEPSLLRSTARLCPCSICAYVPREFISSRISAIKYT